MGKFLLDYCLIVNLTGVVFLVRYNQLGFGIALTEKYDYLKIDHDDMASGAQTCYISAGLYLIYPLIYLILYFKKNKFSCCKKQPKMIEDILLKDIDYIKI